MWELNDTLLNDKWFKEEIKRDIKNYLERNENESTTSNIVGCSKNNSDRKVYSNIKKLERST